MTTTDRRRTQACKKQRTFDSCVHQRLLNTRSVNRRNRGYIRTGHIRKYHSGYILYCYIPAHTTIQKLKQYLKSCYITLAGCCKHDDECRDISKPDGYTAIKLSLILLNCLRIFCCSFMKVKPNLLDTNPLQFGFKKLRAALVRFL